MKIPNIDGDTASKASSRIQSLGRTRINFFRLSWIDFQPICIKRDWKLFSDWLERIRIGSATDFGMYLKKSDWLERN